MAQDIEPKNETCPQCEGDDTTKYLHYFRCHSCGCRFGDTRKRANTIREDKIPARFQTRTEGEERLMGERRETAPTGATRENLYPKGPDFPMRFDLIFTNPEALQRLARTYGEGCQKYGPTNWKNGFPESMLIAHALDHLQKWMQGSKEDDLAHLVWNIMTLMWIQENKPGLLDLTGILNTVVPYLPDSSIPKDV